MESVSSEFSNFRKIYFAQSVSLFAREFLNWLKDHFFSVETSKH